MPATPAAMTTLPMEQAHGHLEKGQTFLRQTVLSICLFGTLSAVALGEYIHRTQMSLPFVPIPRDPPLPRPPLSPVFQSGKSQSLCTAQSYTYLDFPSPLSFRATPEQVYKECHLLLVGARIVCRSTYTSGLSSSLLL